MIVLFDHGQVTVGEFDPERLGFVGSAQLRAPSRTPLVGEGDIVTLNQRQCTQRRSVGAARRFKLLMIPISKARARLSELVRVSSDDDVVLMNYSAPAAVLTSAERYEAILEEIEDLKDQLSVYERTGVTVLADELMAELGIAVTEPARSTPEARRGVSS